MKVQTRLTLFTTSIFGIVFLLSSLFIYAFYAKSAKERAAVIALNIRDLDSGEVTFRLDREFDIATRSGIHCAPLAHESIGTIKQGAVRFSLGYFTKKEEIDEAIKALKIIASEK